jgi:hypothetical protein
LIGRVVGLDDTFDLDMWKAQFGLRSKEICPPENASGADKSEIKQIIF